MEFCLPFNPFTPGWPHTGLLIDFTLFNARQFYSSTSGEPLGNERVKV